MATVQGSGAAAIVKPALKFLVLTAARLGEVRLATRDETNTTDHVWTIQAKRLRAKGEHPVALCGRAT